MDIRLRTINLIDSLKATCQTYGWVMMEMNIKL